MIYFSIDIETNGLCAGINSMVSLGCAAINLETGEIVAKFKNNLIPLSNMKVDEDTMLWWRSQSPEAYSRAFDNAVDAELVMREFVAWVQQVCGEFGITRPVSAAWKPGFDMAFVRYYLHRFHGKDIFGRGGSGLDIKTLAAIALNQPFGDTTIGTVPSTLKGSDDEHNHDALDDAIEQAHVLYNARKLLGVSL